jgi:acetolactate decarboxylase
MREALKLGQSHGRVGIDDVLEPHTYGLGALANLEGEITIIDGKVHIAEVSSGELIVRPHTSEDEATLLVTADAEMWELFSVSAPSDYSQLEKDIAKLCEEQGLDVSQPIPFWVKGTVSEMHLHVINGACPIATPEGPEPLRLQEKVALVNLFGIYVEGAAGIFTHHDRNIHMHAIAPASGNSGHVDAITFHGVTSIWIPALP